MKGLAFVDTETTGLDPDRHGVWEIAVITTDLDRSLGPVNEAEHTYFVYPDLSVADPTALRINRFYERVSIMSKSWGENGSTGSWSDPKLVAAMLARDLAGRHMAGAVPSFDANFLERFVRRNGFAPAWHYHLVDVEALAAGKLGVHPPWESDDLYEALGVPQSEESKHTALGDARQALRVYKAVFNAS